MSQIIDGKQIAASIRADLRAKVQNLQQKNITPGLAVVLVGSDPASQSYVTAKERACAEIGIFSLDLSKPITLDVYTDDCADLADDIKPFTF